MPSLYSMAEILTRKALAFMKFYPNIYIGDFGEIVSQLVPHDCGSLSLAAIQYDNRLFN